MQNHKKFEIIINGIIYQVETTGTVKESNLYQVCLNEEVIVEIYFNGETWVGVTDLYNRDMVDAFGAAIQEKLL